MKKYDVKLLPAAYSDLDEIFDYIMVNNQESANGILDNIILSLHRLGNYPHSGAPLLDCSLKKFNFKMVVVDPYIAFYRLIDDQILVYRILHGARNCPHLLEKMMKLK
ncbi:MAG: type II toxin-antitoxin system RelE/ParE family toxin [Firmicutes bacterium HGW-Firmicutes-14]|jgi:plasmid stabilization system protein ParE|nr:MAG: type II toxin-antitoxin system RelE/ParE family toxin [Firmicutes bacterium HGW-Firmicutes-14]